MSKFTETSTMLPASVLDEFKYEVANELGLNDDIKAKGWSEMSSRDCGRVGGKIGGQMVKVMMREAQKNFTK